MKKKIVILSFAAMLLASCSVKAVEVKPKRENEKPISQQIQDLISSYIDESGNYTKKTTICFTEEAHKELDKYFHCGQIQPKRTTYYDDTHGQLLMSCETGEFDAKTKYTDSGYGGYRLDNGKVYRFVAAEGATLDNVFDGQHIFQKGQASYSNVTDFSNVFVNLSKFLREGYYTDGDWEYSEEYKQYTHDINPGEGQTENDDCYYPDVLAFAAPMLKPNYAGSNYLHIQSIGIAERRDVDDVPYLSIKIYVKDADTGKVTGECGPTTMSEARIYKGMKEFGAEDLSTGYYLKGTVSGESVSYKMTLDADNKDQYYVKGLSLKREDLLTIYSTDNFGTWHNEYEHHWSDPVVKGGGHGTDYKVQMTSESYDVYFKPNENKSWVTASKDVMFFKPNANWKTDGAKMAVRFFGDGVSEKWDWMTDLGNGLYSFKVPQEYFGKQFILCRMKNNATELNWDNRWNQSGDLSHGNDDINNCMTLEEGAWDKGPISYSAM